MNPGLLHLTASVIRDLNDRKRPTTIDLGMGEPTLRPDVAPLRAAQAWLEQHGCPYSPSSGFAELRRLIARRYDLPGLREEKNVCVTVGSQEALQVALKTLLDPATDEALVVTPAYPLYTKACLLEGVALRTVALDPAAGFAADAALVLAAVTPRTRVIVLGSPGNPSGRVWPLGELAALAEGLSQRGGGVWLLSDQVYEELYFTAERPVSPAQLYPRTVVVGSLSKSCALTGLRLGWALAPDEVAGALMKVHHLTVSCAGTYAQRAAIEILQKPEILSAHRGAYAHRREVLLRALAAHGLGAVAPDGAFYCLVRLEGRWAKDSLGAAYALLAEHDVVAVPGVIFGAEGFLRLSFVGDEAVLQEGPRRIRAFLEQ